MLIEKDPDGLNQVTARMLADSLKINLKDLMPANHSGKNQQDSTAHASGQIPSVNKSDLNTVAPFIYSSINTNRSAEQYQTHIKATSVFDPYPQQQKRNGSQQSQ